MNETNQHVGRVDRGPQRQSIPIQANFNDPMDFDPGLPVSYSISHTETH